MKTKQATVIVAVLLSLLTWTETASAFYNPTTGKWLSRDPIKERGGKGLYGFAANNPINRIDYLGLLTAPPPPGEGFDEYQGCYKLGSDEICFYKYVKGTDLRGGEQELGEHHYPIGVRLNWDAQSCRCMGESVWWTVRETYLWMEAYLRIVSYKYKNGVLIEHEDTTDWYKGEFSISREFVREMVSPPYVVSGRGESECRDWQIPPLWPYGDIDMPEAFE